MKILGIEVVALDTCPPDRVYLIGKDRMGEMLAQCVYNVAPPEPPATLTREIGEWPWPTSQK